MQDGLAELGANNRSRGRHWGRGSSSNGSACDERAARKLGKRASQPGDRERNAETGGWSQSYRHGHAHSAVICHQPLGHRATPPPTSPPATEPPTASATPVSDQLLPDQPFDPAALPAIDASTWVTYEGPRGEFRLRVPRGCVVTIDEQTDYTGEVVIGDSAHVVKVAKPGKYDFHATSGDVVADIFTSPNEHPYESHEGRTYQTDVPATVSGQTAKVLAVQYDDEPGFDSGLGFLTLFLELEGSGGQHLTAAVNIVLPANLSRVAEALALLTELTLK